MKFTLNPGFTSDLAGAPPQLHRYGVLYWYDACRLMLSFSLVINYRDSRSET
mgnify:FL=1